MGQGRNRAGWLWATVALMAQAGCVPLFERDTEPPPQQYQQPPPQQHQQQPPAQQYPPPQQPQADGSNQPGQDQPVGPAPPAGAQPYTPERTPHASANPGQPAAPPGQPAGPAPSEQPAQPEQPYPPAEGQPAPPAEGQPGAPVAEQPGQPYGGQPTGQPYGGQPAQPYGQPPYGQPYGQPMPPPEPPQHYISPSDRPGDLEMIGLGAGLGLFGGLVLVDLRDIDDGGIGTTVVLGTTAAGAGLGFLAGEKLHITKGEADFGIVGLLVGAANGALLAKPLELSDDSEQWAPFVWGTTALGSVGALAAARAGNYTRGQSLFISTIALTGVYSTLLGVAVAQKGELDDDEGALVTLALGLDAGVAAGLILAPRIDWSPKRARFVAGATLIGAAGGLSAGALITGDSKDSRTISTAGLVGLWAGLLGGVGLSSEWDPDPRFRQEDTDPSGEPPSYTLIPVVSGDQAGAAIAGQF